MIWLLGGYLWLYIHRPFEVWPELGLLQIERGYMLLMLVFWLIWPGKRFVSNGLHVALAFLVGAIWVSWMMSPYPEAGGLVVENYAKVMVFYVLLVSSVRTDQDLRQLMGVLTLAYGLYMLHSLREYVGGRYGYAQGVQRMMGVDVTYADPNQFATCILLGLPLVYAYFGVAKGMKYLMILGQMLLTGVCILLTCSRAGIIGMGFFLFLCVCVSKNRLLGFALLGCLGVMGMAAMPGYVIERMMTLVDSEAGPNVAHDSAAGRLAGLLKGLELLEMYPLHGVGPGGFGEATAKGFQAHNLYGQVAGELGLLGILGLGLLLIYFFANWRRAGRLAREQPWLVETMAYRVLRGVGLGVLLLLLNGMAGHTLYRYNWVWLAAFQVVALRVLEEHAAFGRQVEPTWVYLPVSSPSVAPSWGY